ncbi:hypothetical protein P4233_08835 [Pseudomonas aeruginosa]|nr:hypothetical protein [Pseudomonas aeruginosa]
MELATDHPRTARQASPAARYSLRVDEALARAIREAALDHEASVFMWLLAAFQALLHRHSGRARSASACPAPTASAWRPRAGRLLHQHPGPARTPRARQPFAALLGEAREATLGAQANQDLPFDQVLAACGQGGQLVPGAVQPPAARPVGVAPAARPARRRAALAQPRSQVRPATAERGGRPRSPDPEFRLRRGPFDEASIRRFAAQYLELLRQVAEDPQRCLGDIALVDAEQAAHLAEWGSAPASRRAPGCRSCWSGNWRSPPNASPWSGTAAAPATPNEHARANRLAHYLREWRRPGRAVAICARAFAATAGRSAGDRQGGRRLRAAGPGLPQRTPGLHARRQWRRAAADPGPSFERLPGAEGVTPICLDSLKLDNWPSQAPGLHLHGDNLALRHLHLRLHRPAEGVGNTHAALAERLQWMQATYTLDGDDVLMQKAPVSFDVSVWSASGRWSPVAGWSSPPPASTAIRRAWWNWCGSSG